MRTRPVYLADIPALEAIYAEREYKFDIPSLGSVLTEEAMVVESDTGEIVAAGFAIRTPEIVLLMGNGHVLVKLEAIRRIHEAMRESLRRKGYGRAFAVVSPHLKAYIRHMKKRFGWVEDFPSFRIE